MLLLPPAHRPLLPSAMLKMLMPCRHAQCRRATSMPIAAATA